MKAHCNECGHETNHTVIGSDTESWVEDLGDGAWMDGSVTHTMLKCKGCNSVCMRKDDYLSEWDGTQVDYFPPAISRPEPRWLTNLSDELQELLREVYTALHADSRRLAMMGARAVIDRVFADKLGSVKNFGDGLERLESAGFLSKSTVAVLKAAIEAGHAAAHRGHKASKEGVGDVLDIVEQLLHAVYITPVAAARLKKTTPRRSRRKK